MKGAAPLCPPRRQHGICRRCRTAALEFDTDAHSSNFCIAVPTPSPPHPLLFLPFGQMASAAVTARPREAVQLNPEALEFISSRSGSESGSPVRCSSPTSSAQASGVWLCLPRPQAPFAALSRVFRKPTSQMGAATRRQGAREYYRIRPPGGKRRPVFPPRRASPHAQCRSRDKPSRRTHWMQAALRGAPAAAATAAA